MSDTKKTPSSSKRILVLGVGNLFRCDDGAGILVARRVAAFGLENVEVRELAGEGASLMESWRSFDFVILVDAVSSKYPPGSIHRLDPLEDEIPTEFFHYSTHAFSVAESVEVARALGRLPKKMVLFGIEGGNFGMGTELSEEVVRAIPEAAHQVRLEINRFNREMDSELTTDPTEHR